MSTASGCGGEESASDPDCDGAKCDIPDGSDQDMCTARRADAFNENQLAYQPSALRWSCADVAGVTAEDQGQEYCEYFAVVSLPDEDDTGEPAVLGRNLGPDYTYGTTESSLDLDLQQIRALEEDESAVVGQCVFSSWNSDIDDEVPACTGKDADCPDVMGLPVTAEDFRMTFEVNSAEAAQILVEECLAWPGGGDPDDEDDPRGDDFYRGCLHNADLNDTAFRKSDTTICGSAMRLGECNCWPAESLETDNFDDFPVLLSPWERRGFPLGTWSDASGLPAGCRHVALGDDSQTLVSCDLTAAEVLTYSIDLRGHCRQKYADNVVVHVPLPPSEGIVCTPSESSSPFAGTCGETPWLLED